MTGPLTSILDRLGSRPAWVTVIDLALVYFLIYRALLTIRGTRAAQMVVGIVLVGAGFYAARRLELTAVSWLLDNVINYLILIVIVVFQADIRRALGRIGQGVIPRGKGDNAGELVDEVTAAVAQLARARRGAIIVIEREGDVANFVDDATRLDARLSRQLLVTLFVPAADNELHDGAVVIGKSRRIELARALLPLSRAAELGPELGTRHRAALGITEDTDAIAVVVSEERGQVSICYRGHIARDLDPATLRRALHELLSAGAHEVVAAAEIGSAVASLGQRERALGGP
ncbi:MAG: TIGR00159 family protein [Myxococcales bacterium]|nr:TIGR00159 family protein [Myxococcales bacterium]